MPMSIVAALFASSCERVAALSRIAHCALPLRSVNTSLSWTLFFSMCWCIRDEVHFDSRVHAANSSHLTYIGGQHGEES
jgi:hypothetical protein